MNREALNKLKRLISLMENSETVHASEECTCGAIDGEPHAEDCDKTLAACDDINASVQAILKVT